MFVWQRLQNDIKEMQQFQAGHKITKNTPPQNQSRRGHSNMWAAPVYPAMWYFWEGNTPSPELPPDYTDTFIESEPLTWLTLKLRLRGIKDPPVSAS